VKGERVFSNKRKKQRKENEPKTAKVSINPNPETNLHGVMAQFDMEMEIYLVGKWFLFQIATRKQIKRRKRGKEGTCLHCI